MIGIVLGHNCLFALRSTPKIVSCNHYALGKPKKIGFWGGAGGPLAAGDLGGDSRVDLNAGKCLRCRCSMVRAIEKPRILV